MGLTGNIHFYPIKLKGVEKQLEVADCTLYYLTQTFSRLILLISTVLSSLGKASVPQNPLVNNYFTIIYKHLG